MKGLSQFPLLVTPGVRYQGKNLIDKRSCKKVTSDLLYLSFPDPKAKESFLHPSLLQLVSMHPGSYKISMTNSGQRVAK